MPSFGRRKPPPSSQHHPPTRASECALSQQSKRYSMISCYSDEESPRRKPVRHSRKGSKYHSSWETGYSNANRQTKNHSYCQSPEYDSSKDLTSKSYKTTYTSTRSNKQYHLSSSKQYDYPNSKSNQRVYCNSPEHEEHEVEGTKPRKRTYSSSKPDRTYGPCLTHYDSCRTKLRTSSRRDSYHVVPEAPRYDRIGSKIVDWDDGKIL
jgi:hypothetical protein